ncbi:MAG: polyribonucleotide nucleotidyltransferase [Bacillota bacterium]|nr:polyribonucleotide nucleotidyltransferase [Bacillota bacterium]
MKRRFEMDLCGRPLIVETGELAQFANGSALLRYGDTVVLSTATISKAPRPGIDFFPLSVDYEEKMYAVGKFPGGFLKREGRPTEKAILTGRAIDRPMRPLFPGDFRNDCNVQNLVLSVDQDNDPNILAMTGSSLAVSISDIPWNGPTASVAVAIVDDEIIVMPNEEQRFASSLDLTLAGTEDLICMIEAGANEVPEEQMIAAIEAGHEVIKSLCRFINEIRAEVGKEKIPYESTELSADFRNLVAERSLERMRAAVLSADKNVRDEAVAELTEDLKAYVAEVAPESLELVDEAVYQLEKRVVRDYLIREQRRVDGRALEEIRPLSAQVGLLPRTHGSGVFQRGQTQVLTVCTLAPLSKVQILDGLDNEDSKRYLHHYNFPGFSVGEARSSRSPGRREIGHGALAERSVAPVLPDEDEFPYAIRNVSEVLMSNGSTSQGAVCASTLALMDAGVPIRRPVAGISTGLIQNPDDPSDHMVFMDIQGIEDFFGDMDFKVAGTTEGITGIQVDIKIDGLTMDVIREAFALARQGRLQIINEVILPCIEAPRAELSAFAPKILQTQIDPERISEVIGKGGKVINKIIDETGTEIDVEDDGRVFVSCVDLEMGQRALSIIEGIATDPEPGQSFVGQVTRLMNFGAFVEYLPGKEGLVHISKLAWERVASVEDVVSVGDTVTVKVIEIDDQGRINLSIRDTLPQPEGWVEPERSERSGGPRNRDGGRPSRGDSRGGRDGARGGRGPSRGSRGGRDRDGGHFRERRRDDD